MLVIIKNGAFIMQKYNVTTLAEVPAVGDTIKFAATGSSMTVADRILGYGLIMEDGPLDVTLEMRYK